MATLTSSLRKALLKSLIRPLHLPLCSLSIGAFLIIIGSPSGYISKAGADWAVPVLIIDILRSRTRAPPHVRTSLHPFIHTHAFSIHVPAHLHALARACTLHTHRSELFPLSPPNGWLLEPTLPRAPSFAAARSLPSALSSQPRSRSQPHRPVRRDHCFPPHIPGDTRWGVAPPTHGWRDSQDFPSFRIRGGSGDCGEAFLILAGERTHLVPKASLLFLYFLPEVVGFLMICPDVPTFLGSLALKNNGKKQS
nr:uncharacterized protein LOC107972647 [Pan troglodytes]